MGMQQRIGLFHLHAWIDGLLKIQKHQKNMVWDWISGSGENGA